MLLCLMQTVAPISGCVYIQTCPKLATRTYDCSQTRKRMLMRVRRLLVCLMVAFIDDLLHASTRYLLLYYVSPDASVHARHRFREIA